MANDEFTPIESPEEPVDMWGVASAITGAIIVGPVDRDTAVDELERLTDEVRAGGIRQAGQPVTLELVAIPVTSQHPIFREGDDGE